MIVSGWAEWREVGGGALIVATENELQGASRVGLTLVRLLKTFSERCAGRGI